MLVFWKIEDTRISIGNFLTFKEYGYCATTDVEYKPNIDDLGKFIKCKVNNGAYTEAVAFEVSMGDKPQTITDIQTFDNLLLGTVCHLNPKKLKIDI